MKIRKLFFFIMLVLLLVGFSYASEVSNDTLADTNTADTTSVDATTPSMTEKVAQGNDVQEELENTITDERNSNTQITKQTINNKTVKEASKTYTVNDFNTLHSILSSNTYNKVTVNIKSNIKLTENTELNEAIETLTINGNEKTIDGNNEYQFLYIHFDSKVNIKNIRIAHCNAKYGGAINNTGKLIITNVTLTNNTAKYGGGAIYNYYGNLTIRDSTLTQNTVSALGSGGAIYNNGTLTIQGSVLTNNKALKNGGAIYNDGELIIQDSKLTNNKIREYKGNGGAIYNNGELTIQNTTLTNNKLIGESHRGGAIYNNRTLTIQDSIFMNNTTGIGGAIYNNGTLTITNNTLTQNTATGIYGNGGVICNRGTLIIQDSIFSNNTAEDGGAIVNNGELTITNTKLTNNIAKIVGGAISNGKYGTMNIQDSTLTQNTAEYGGGAIDNQEGTITLQCSSLINNTSKGGGGAINNEKGTITITNTTLQENTATENGGAIQNWGGTITLQSSTLTNNTADVGGAIYNHGNASIDNNMFKINKANIPCKAIINNGTATIKDNIGDDISMDSCTIYTDGDNVNITNNVFEDGRYPTWIKIAYMSNVKYGSTVNVVGRLLYNGTTPIKYTKVNVTVNNKIYQVKTDGSGYIRLNYTVKNYDSQKIIFKYAGSNIYLASTNSTSFLVKQPTWIKIAYRSNVKYGSTVNIVGRLLYNSTTPLKYKPVVVTINGKEYNTTTDGAGYIRLNYTVKNYDTQKITFKYKGSTTHLSSTNSTTFMVKQPTWIKIAYMSNVKYGATVNIVGRLLYNGTTPLKYRQVIVTVNGKDYNTTTDGAGYIRLNYTVKSYDLQKITFKFKGSTTHLSSTNSTTFKVKQPTWIKHATLSTVKVGGVARIVGKIMYNGTNPVKYSMVKVTVNGDVYDLKTDGAGYFRLNYTVTSAGVITFTSRYAGSTLYVSSTNSTKFTAVKS